MERPRPTGTWARGCTIGHGAFGTVSLARDQSSGLVFAVKSVDLNSSPLPSILSLENEIQILRSLTSPYIVSYLGDDVTGAGTLRNLHTEYMPGGTVAKDSPIGELHIRAYARCLARALHYLHSVAGVVHGDVKGRNVLLGHAPGVAKLADFGSARRLSDDGAESPTRGTPLWMAPEVVRGGTTTPASDVWSLGCTVIEMATGRQPWGECDLLRIGFGDEVPEFPARLSKSGRDFLDKCLRKDAADRWTSEQLLRHPFLAAGNGGDDGWDMGASPRSVRDWVNWEFELDGCNWERIRDLVSDDGPVDWETDGWEVVRWVGRTWMRG